MGAPLIDYRELLKKYIAHVSEQEGIDFLDGYIDELYTGPFTEDEARELLQLSEEIR